MHKQKTSTRQTIFEPWLKNLGKIREWSYDKITVQFARRKSTLLLAAGFSTWSMDSVEMPTKKTPFYFSLETKIIRKKTFFASKTCPSKIHVYSRSTNVCPNNACQIFNVADFQLVVFVQKRPSHKTKLTKHKPQKCILIEFKVYIICFSRPRDNLVLHPLR